MSPVGNQPEQEKRSGTEVARQKYKRKNGTSKRCGPGDTPELQNEVAICRKQEHEHKSDERSFIRIANNQSEQDPGKDGKEEGESYRR